MPIHKTSLYFYVSDGQREDESLLRVSKFDASLVSNQTSLYFWKSYIAKKKTEAHKIQLQCFIEMSAPSFHVVCCVVFVDERV